MRPKSFARFVAFLALAMAAACDPGASVPSAAEGYTLELFARDGEQIYLVRHSDGRKAAARVVNGASALMDADQAQTLLSEGQAALREPEKANVSIRAPGFSLQVADDEGGGSSERARIEINAGGKHFLIDAEEEGEADRAVVRVDGADEEAARDFINEQAELSAQTKAQMLRAMGL
jgi:hypothetical protein